MKDFHDFLCAADDLSGTLAKKLKHFVWDLSDGADRIISKINDFCSTSKSEFARKVVLAWEWWPGGERSSPWTFWEEGGSFTSYNDLDRQTGIRTEERRQYYHSASGNWRKIRTDYYHRYYSEDQIRVDFHRYDEECLDMSHNVQVVIERND